MAYMVQGIISGQVQGFYAWRLYKLNAQKLVVVAIYMLAIATCCMSHSPFIQYSSKCPKNLILLQCDCTALAIAIGVAVHMSFKPQFLLFKFYTVCSIPGEGVWHVLTSSAGPSLGLVFYLCHQ